MRPRLPLLLSILALLLAACAAPPAPQPEPAPTLAVEPTPAPTPPPPPPPALSRLICDVTPARKTLFADLGLPEGSRARDVALTRSTVWLLFEPALLVGLPRQAPGAPKTGEFEELDETELVYGAPGDTWESVSVSPRDGSLWISSSRSARLWRKPPLGRVRPVKIPKLPEGGLHDALAAWDGIYVAPTACGGNAVWRIDPAGKLLGAALPTPAGACPAVDLERDGGGQAYAFLPGTGELFRLQGGDRWQPAGGTPAVPVPPSGAFGTWFFWGVEPVALGSGDTTTLYRRTAEGTAAFEEDCGEGNRLLRAAGDRQGWAALTRDWLLLGEY